ncbi:MAG: molybdopterin-dependent oxidoreductase [Actinobacteria bacterium]|nr:molybdopterin-dependent oxidoreductase [Actinomycetota bacterium]
MITAVVIAVLLTALFVYVGLTMRTPGEKARLSSGREVTVTPVDKMRVRTAEGQPEVDVEKYRLTVGGLVENELSLSFEDIQAMPVEERYVRLPCVEGWSEDAIWKGVRLSDLLERAGVDEGARTVVFSSPNEYTTSLTVADVEKTDPILAYQVNGERLPDAQGYPLRLVVPNKLGYKWVKWVDSIELISGDYEGYWESRGYSNDADATGR